MKQLKELIRFEKQNPAHYVDNVSFLAAKFSSDQERHCSTLFSIWNCKRAEACDDLLAKHFRYIKKKNQEDFNRSSSYVISINVSLAFQDLTRRSYCDIFNY